MSPIMARNAKHADEMTSNGAAYLSSQLHDDDDGGNKRSIFIWRVIEFVM